MSESPQAFELRNPLAVPSADELRSLRLLLDPTNPEARQIWDYWTRGFYVGDSTFDPNPQIMAHKEGLRRFVIIQAAHVGINPLNLLKRK